MMQETRPAAEARRAVPPEGFNAYVMTIVKYWKIPPLLDCAQESNISKDCRLLFILENVKNMRRITFCA